jgi:hypothetical protein
MKLHRFFARFDEIVKNQNSGQLCKKSAGNVHKYLGMRITYGYFAMTKNVAQPCIRIFYEVVIFSDYKSSFPTFLRNCIDIDKQDVVALCFIETQILSGKGR